MPLFTSDCVYDVGVMNGVDTTSLDDAPVVVSMLFRLWNELTFSFVFDRGKFTRTEGNYLKWSKFADGAILLPQVKVLGVGVKVFEGK